jgi:sortase A
MPKRKRFWVFLAIRTVANTLIISGIVFSFLAFAPFVKQEIWYWWTNSLLGSFKTNTTVQTTQQNPAAAKTYPPLGVTPVNTDFGIVIEKIDVNAPVVANVDASNYREYIAALSKGAAHAKGTAFPGSTKAENNNVFIFAHSAADPIFAHRYNSVFYLLRKIEVGDRVTTFYKGKRYDYIVIKKEVIKAEDTRYLTQPSKDPILTLQTCDPPGSSLRRLIVTAKLDQL